MIIKSSHALHQKGVVFEEVTEINLSNEFYQAKDAKLFAKCKQVKKLTLSGLMGADEIPDFVFGYSQLEELSLLYMEVKDFPTGLSRLKNLKRIFLKNCGFRYLDEAICTLEHLEELTVRQRIAPQFPVHFDQLKNLKRLDLLGMTGLVSLPEEVLELPKLEELHLAPRLFKKVIKEHKEFVKQLHYLPSFSSVEKKHLPKVVELLSKEKYPSRLRFLVLNILGGHTEKVQKIAKIEDLINLLNFPRIEYIRLETLSYIDHFYPKALEKLEKGSHLLVTGKLNSNKKDLQALLKKVGVKYQAKLNDKTTHVLIGQSPKAINEAALDKKLPLITEKRILDYLNNNVDDLYLLEEDEDQELQNENLKMLLLSQNEDGIQTAFSLIREGGLPKVLRTSLFLLYLEYHSDKIRRQTKRLLGKLASPELLDKAKRYLTYHSYALWYKQGSKSIIQAVNFFAEELDRDELLDYVWKNNEPVQRYIWKAFTLERQVEKLKNYMDTKKKSLDLSRMGLKTLPAGIYELADLEYLNLSNNALTTIPQKIKKLKKLLRVEVVSNNFSAEKETKLKEFFSGLKVDLVLHNK